MIDHKLFLEKKHGFIIAPAGHGKTHAIAECLLHADGKQLILTHTHAGIASIKEKILKSNPPAANYHIETITGYAQKYVLAYYRGGEIPSQENAEEYYPFILREATRIFQLTAILKVLKQSYKRIFVDEYQDCTLSQHRLISALSDILPTYILGDPMQGIFNFNGELMIDLTNKDHMNLFKHNQHELKTPWRWKNSNEELGETLKSIRELIVNKQPIDLRLFKNIKYINVNSEEEIYKPDTEYNKQFAKLLNQEGLLILHHNSTSVYPRKKIISKFKIPINLVESIDDKDFYKLARKFDIVTYETIGSIIYNTALELFSKTEVKIWFNEDGLKDKRKPEDQLISYPIAEKINLARETKSTKAISQALRLFHDIKSVRSYRRELLYSLCNALESAEEDQTSVYESMVAQRNLIRRMGRRNYGRNIGTTLLTKGLEFDNVIILDAHLFKCPKNLYVALTRASKNLTVFSKEPILNPY